MNTERANKMRKYAPKSTWIQAVQKQALITVVGLSALSAVLSGCNTVEGVGTDIQSAGRGLKDAATCSKDKNCR